MSVPGDVIGEIEAKASRPVGGGGPIDLDEAEAWIELADHVILGRRDVIGDQRAHPALPRRLDRDIHGLELELAAEHAAAHHPILDLERIVVASRGTQDHRAHKAVVADPIEEAEMQRERRGVVQDLRDLIARGAARGCVELIGLVDELDDAGVVDGGERAIDGGHFEPAQEFVHAFGGAEESLALGVGGVLFGPVPIVRGEGDGFEIAGVRKATDIMRWVLRDFRDRDHRQALAHAGPLDRIVVDEHESVDPNVELGRDRLEILRLVVPIRLEGGEVGAAQDHFRMIAKRGLGDPGVVLGAYGEDDSALFELRA